MPQQPPIRRQRSPLRRRTDYDYLMMRELAAEIRRALGRAGGAILDVGCGHQPYRQWLGPHRLYVGADLDWRGNRPQVASTALSLPFADDSADTVLCFEVLEHVPQPFAAVAELARVLRPGGVLLLTTPQSWRLHEAPHDYFRYTRFGLQRLAEDAGLAVEEIRPIGGVWANAGQTALNAWPHRQLGPLLKPAILAVNLICAALEAVWRDQRDPLGHLLVARKPPAGTSGAGPS